jgi:hypothetical protein
MNYFKKNINFVQNYDHIRIANFFWEIEKIEHF